MQNIRQSSWGHCSLKVLDSERLIIYSWLHWHRRVFLATSSESLRGLAGAQQCILGVFTVRFCGAFISRYVKCVLIYCCKVAYMTHNKRAHSRGISIHFPPTQLQAKIGNVQSWCGIFTLLFNSCKRLANRYYLCISSTFMHSTFTCYSQRLICIS